MLGPDWRALLDEAGSATPLLDGHATRRVGTWVPYELLEHGQLLWALAERCLIDFRLELIRRLGKHRLPGSVGRDITRAALESASAMPVTNRRDWEGQIRWINELSEETFELWVRGTLAEGLYQAQGF